MLPNFSKTRVTYISIDIYVVLEFPVCHFRLPSRANMHPFDYNDAVFRGHTIPVVGQNLTLVVEIWLSSQKKIKTKMLTPGYHPAMS